MKNKDITTEDYVSYETAKLLKEKGFDVPYYYCTRVYSDNGTLQGINSVKFKGVKYICAPTLQMAMKWLREVYHLTIDVFHFRDWKVIIKTIPDDYFKADYSYPELKPTETYEKACEVGIKYCLENLI